MNKIKILIVEDEIIIAKALELFLKKIDFEVLIASKDQDALEILNSFIPDIILMDIMLNNSKMDGIDLAKEILKNYDIPIIFITAYIDEEIIERIKNISSYGYLVKPIDNKNLLILIKITLQKHKYEKIIKEKESLFSKFLNSIDEGFIGTDLNNCIKFINKAALNLINEKNEEEINGEKINSIFRFLNPEKLLEKTKIYKCLIYYKKTFHHN